MNDLQLALIGFGVLLVAAVWGYNFRQERKYRSQAETMLPPGSTDILMAGRQATDSADAADETVPSEPREPTLGTEPEDSLPDEAAVFVSAPAPAAAAAPVAELPAEWADGRADCLVRIEFVDAQPVAGLWAEQADWSELIDKPLQWLGLDGKSGRWRVLHAEDAGLVTQLAAALQLTDRRGTVGAAALGTFIDGIHRLARRFSGLVDLPDPAKVQARAAELDAFCAVVDLQLSLHVVPRPGSIGGMVGAKLAPVIAAAGLRREGDRLFAADENGNESFALICQTARGDGIDRIDSLVLTGLTFSLDVPRVEDGAVAFARMLQLALQCAGALGGQLADAHGQPLADATVDAIRARIDELQAKMARMAIPAGSVRALRLFS